MHFYCLVHLVQVIDMPLLFETRAERFMSAVVVVSCDPEEQLKRLQARNNLTFEEATARVNSQMPVRDKERKATLVIDNNGRREETIAQVRPAHL
jgi:dephospho-CoA kinase